MKFSTYCFIIIPIVLLGCGSYHYFNTHKEDFKATKLPEVKPEMQKKADKLNGRKGK